MEKVDRPFDCFGGGFRGAFGSKINQPNIGDLYCSSYRHCRNLAAPKHLDQIRLAGRELEFSTL